jgi:glycosyltransferase involved in cell wall biosynthesis
MRILFVAPGYKPAWRIGGPAVSVSASAEALARAGHQVTVFTTNSNLDEDLDVVTDKPVDVQGVEVWYFRHEEPFDWFFGGTKRFAQSLGTLYAPKMRRELLNLIPHVDLVHTHLPFNYPTYAAARAAFRCHKPLFYHQRGVLDPYRLKFGAPKKYMYLKLVELPILRRATTLIALTAAEAESYTRLGVTTPSRLVPNGINTEPEPISCSVTDLGIGNQELVVLFLGRLHPIKGPERLLRAFTSIAAEFPQTTLVIAGPDEVGLQSRLEVQAAAAGLSSRVRFPGMVTGDLKRRLLARADLFCLPSAAEGFSMAVLEALACGTPVLISEGCHFPDVERAGAGSVVRIDLDSLEGGLRRMLSNPSGLKEAGERGYRLVSQEYSWQRVTSTLIDTYVEGIQRHRARRQLICA